MERARSPDIVRSKGRLRELTGNEIVSMAEELGMRLRRVSASQLRRFLEAVNRIKASPRFDEDEAVMLRYRLAYATSRERGLSPFMEVLDIALGKVHDADDFYRLARLVEAVVAYHAFHGGRD